MLPTHRVARYLEAKEREYSADARIIQTVNCNYISGGTWDPAQAARAAEMGNWEEMMFYSLTSKADFVAHLQTLVDEQQERDLPSISCSWEAANRPACTPPVPGNTPQLVMQHAGHHQCATGVVRCLLWGSKSMKTDNCARV